jgi:hypothetical protein
METLRPPDRLSARVIEDYCPLLESPASRLRFIRRAVSRCQAEGVGGKRGLRWPLFEVFRVRKIVIEELVPFLPGGRALPLSVRLAFLAFRLRVPIYVAGVCAVAITALVAAFTAIQAAPAIEPRGSTANGATPTIAAVIPAALANEVPAYEPGQIWLVERGRGYELYSNGARILTEFEVEGEPRRYYAFPLAGIGPESGEERSRVPVGLVYHTSQSHIAPFEPEYNQKLQRSTRALLDYVRARKLYNYLIDRFGRIYRVVTDDSVADHAGNSIWADDRYAYLNLSDGFLGVCFEAAWSPETRLAPDQINEAQVYAGRVLTALLRRQYEIADANCVTHALVSVSPTARLVGFHMDWARAFPFAALDLSDKYRVKTPSIAQFGFGHDPAFDRTVSPELWPGILEAEAQLRADASARGVPEEIIRRGLQGRYTAYRIWLARGGRAGPGENG